MAYGVSWDTTTVQNGSYTLTAVARDAAGNTTTSTPVDVTVANAPQTTSTPIAVGSPTHVVVSGTKIYAFNAGNNTVSVIDSTTNQVVGNPIPTGRFAEQMAAAPTGNRVYLTHLDSVSVINTTNNSVTTVPIPVRQDSEIGNYVDGIAVSRDGSRVYIGATDGTITVLNGADSAILSNTSVVDYQAGEMEVSADGTRLYAMNYTGSRVLVLDTADMSVIDQVDLTSGTPFLRLVVNPDGTRTYATGYYGAVAVIDNTSNTQIGTINIADPAGSDPGGVWEAAFSPDGTRAYVTQADGTTVAVINTATNTFIGNVNTDATTTKQNQYIVVAPNGKLYITDFADGKVYVVTVGDPTMV